MNTDLGPFRSNEGASQNRLFADWRLSLTDPNIDWTSEWMDLAVRADDLVRNDATMAALLHAKLAVTHGNTYLRHRSLYSEDGDNETSQSESDMRRLIDDEIEQSSRGTQLDATGMMVRRELEEALDRWATVRGEGWGVRKFITGRPGARISTCWLLVSPDRISNPPGETNGPALFEGIALDANGCRVGIWVGPPRCGIIGRSSDPKDWTYVSWFAEDGSRNIIHRIGLRLPGALRGISCYAPNMALAKQTKGVVDAYVVAKRVQACHPIFISCDDPIAAAKADRNGAVYGPNTTLEPGKVYYVGRDTVVNFSTWQFNGADMRAFLDTLYRNMFAAWGLPICVVLGQMSSGSNQAARSDWMQFYRQGARWQDEHIEQASTVFDESIIREAVAAGRIPAPKDGDWSRLMQGRYVRPPRSMPDPYKEAQAAAAWMDLGRDLTDIYAEFCGREFRDSIMQRHEDNEFLEAQGVQIVTSAKTQAMPGEPIAPVDPNAPADPNNPSPDDTETQENEPVSNNTDE